MTILESMTTQKFWKKKTESCLLPVSAKLLAEKAKKQLKFSHSFQWCTADDMQQSTAWYLSIILVKSFCCIMGKWRQILTLKQVGDSPSLFLNTINPLKSRPVFLFPLSTNRRKKFVLLSTKEFLFSFVNEPPSSPVLLCTYFFVHSVTLHNVARCWLTGTDISVACEHTMISFVWWNSIY